MTNGTDDGAIGVDDIDPWDVDPAEFDDINEFVVEEWKRSTTAAERIQEILETTREPQTASQIAERARVSEPAARKHLKRLAGQTGPGIAIQEGNVTRYMRDPDQARFERIKTLADEHSRSVLETGIRDMKSQIRGFEDAHGVTSPEELVRELSPEDEEGWNAVSKWKTTRKNLSFAKTALAFKETRTVDVMTGSVTDGGEEAPVDDG